VVAFDEIARRGTAEIGEIDAHDLVVIAVEDLAQAQLGLGVPLARCSRFHLPSSPQRNPMEPLGATIWPLASS
jgi:hypothetical protein